jgi:hypothetical protein
MVSSGAMKAFKAGHGHVWAGGMPAGDHFTWLLPAAPVGGTTLVSFTVKGFGLDRLANVCTTGRDSDACLFRLVSPSGCFVGKAATDFLWSARHREQ